MKKAIVKPQPVVVAPKPARPCQREECDRTLVASQKKFCSKLCRVMVFQKIGTLSVSEYKPEYCTTALQLYLDLCEKGNEPTLIPTENSYILIHNAKIPSATGYALFLKVHPHTPENWAKSHPEFAEVLDTITAIQKEYLFNNGLAGRYNSTIAKLGLNVNHGMVERNIVDNTHKLIGVVKHVYEQADKLTPPDPHGNA